MSEHSSYETLGLTEGSSFDEIQEARSRLVAECGEDKKQVEAIEAAYDAILMDRLRMRQEGKIKVPDRIRFAENAPQPPVSNPTPITLSSPDWLSGLVDTPSREDVAWPSIAFAALAILSLAAPEAISLSLPVAVGCGIYFLNRKENRFWRSVLLTFGGLVLGLVVGVTVGQLLIPQGAEFAWAEPNAIAAALTCAILWVVSSFVR